MSRFLIVLLVASSALHATTMTFTSCTAGTTTVSPCPGEANWLTSTGGLSGPNFTVGAFVGASDTSNLLGATSLGLLPTIPSGQPMSAVANAFGEVNGPPPIALAATAQAGAGNTFSTAGPIRPGFVQFDVQLDHLHEGRTHAVLTDGAHQYSYDFGAVPIGSTTPLFCDIEDCGWTATVPFNLGSEFRVSASTDIQETGQFHGGVDSIVVFRLLESNGTTPVPFSVTATPEPSTWGFVLFGLAAAGCWIGRKRMSCQLIFSK